MNKLLSEVPFFANLSEENLEIITKHAIRRSFPKNATIINEGDQTDSLYVVEKGKAKAFLTDRSGREIVLGIIPEGSYFGEIALLDREPRSANVMTLEPSTFLIISHNDFQQCLKDNIEIAMNMLSALTERIRDLTGSIKSLALSNVYRRIVNTLLKMAVEKDGKLMIEDKLTQQDIANMVGSSREMVNKIFHDLIEGGYVSTKNKQITIHKKLPSGW